ncbi:MAG: hypothetical protein J6D34_09385 [Atopobiaceae bacterium]|nr:hypothetical protein [Atopobiaceae bacterium]
MTLSKLRMRPVALALSAALAIMPLVACSKSGTTPATDAAADAKTEGVAVEEATTEAWILTKETYHTEDADHSVYESVYAYSIDEHGNQTGVMVKTAGAEYEQSYQVSYDLDDQGSCVAMTANYGDGEDDPITFTYEYDDQGRIVKRIASNDQVETYTYDDQGNITELVLEFTIADHDGATTNKSTTTYNANGFCTKRSYESAGETWNYLYTYDPTDSDMPTSGVGTDEATGATTNYTFEYDENGNLATITSDTDGAIETTSFEWTLVPEASRTAAAENRLKMFL